MLVTARLMMKVCHIMYAGNMIFIYWEIIYEPLITHFHIFLYFFKFYYQKWRESVYLIEKNETTGGLEIISEILGGYLYFQHLIGGL